MLARTLSAAFGRPHDARSAYGTQYLLCAGSKTHEISAENSSVACCQADGPLEDVNKLFRHFAPVPGVFRNLRWVFCLRKPFSGIFFRLEDPFSGRPALACARVAVSPVRVLPAAAACRLLLLAAACCCLGLFRVLPLELVKHGPRYLPRTLRGVSLAGFCKEVRVSFVPVVPVCPGEKVWDQKKPP